MSLSLFRRAWKVQVDTLDVSNLDIEFEILCSIPVGNTKPVPNHCVLTVWNLNPDHRAQLLKRNNTSGATGIPVQIDAGYEGSVPTLFTGDLREVASIKYGTDWKTTLSGDDGGRAYREGRVNITFKKGTPIATALRQCAQSMGVGTGNLSDVLANAMIDGLGASLPHTMTFSGSAAQLLTRITQSIGIVWSVQQGVMQFQEKGKPLNVSAIEISPKTGLIGSPEASIDSTLSLGNPQQFAAGAKNKVAKPPKPKDPGILRLKTLLIPGMRPGRKIVLESNSYKGGYQITECRYTGQSFGEAWWIDSVARTY